MFQKIEIKDGRVFIVNRNGVGDPAEEFVVNQVSHRGNIFKFKGTYDECMDWVIEQDASAVYTPVILSDIKIAAAQMASENFHRELG